MVNTAVTLCGIELENPVIPASGTFGFGAEFAELYDINKLGTFSFKGTTVSPRHGNEVPRIAETPSGMLNAVGLQNPGVEHVIEKELPELFKVFHKPVMANAGGFSLEEYVQMCEAFDKVPQIGWIEVNISWPNVHGGGIAGVQLSGHDGPGQHGFQVALHEALQGPCAVDGVKARLGNGVHRGVRQVDVNVLLAEAAAQALRQQEHDAVQLGLFQGLVEHNLVDAVEELGPELAAEQGSSYLRVNFITLRGFRAGIAIRRSG